MLKKYKSRFFGGPRIRYINAILMVVACLITVLVFISSIKIKSKYDAIVLSMNDYSECNKAIYELRDASDYLTNQIRLFTVTLEPEYLQNYFYETRELRHRESALEIIEMTHNGDEADNYLKLALQESERLEITEHYVMRLICEASDFTDAEIPDEIMNVSMAEEDKLLSEEALIQKARNLVFDSNYLSSKERIIYYANQTISSLINENIDQEVANDAGIKNCFLHQTFFIAILLVVNVFLYVLLMFLVLKPLFSNLEAIRNGTKMTLKGAYEVRYIAVAYNALCDKNEVTALKLKHKAEHDPLTGLINRNAFDEIKVALMNEAEPIAYLFIDIDLLKKINDEYGHVTGDLVLKKISGMLMEQFRATDYVARVGGDEFAVIMTKFGINPEAIIQRKIDEMNRVLQNVEDGLPVVSLSVGVAFSDKGFRPELIEKADYALYNVKRGGRCNCSFFSEE